MCGEGFLDSLPDLIAEAEGRGQPIVYRALSEPNDATRRLMATLGVRIEVYRVKAISAHEAATTRDCTQPLCVNEAAPGTDRCRTHTRAAELRANGSTERPPAFNGRLAWTKASIVAAMQRWAAEHEGGVPSSSAKGPNSWAKAGEWWPNVATVGILAAGLVPLGDSTAPKGSVRVPQAPETPPASPADDPAVTPNSAVGVESARPAGTEPSTRTDELTDQELAQIQADGAKVDAYLASLEGAKEEVRPLEEVLADFGRALAILHTAQDELSDLSVELKAHPGYENAKEWM